MHEQDLINKKTYAIGLDLGGTFVKYALVDSSGNCLTHGKLPSLAHVSARAVTDQVVKAASQSLEFARENGIPVQGIGIGTPGIVDETQRIVVGAAENIREWENIPLANRVEEEVSLPTLIGNDANLMGLAETRFGAARGCSHAVFLTIGTGIGGAVVIGHRLFNGFANRGTELGHIPLIADGEPCACGSVGCLETYASATALVRHYQTTLEQTTGKTASETAAIDGEEIVSRYLQGGNPGCTVHGKTFLSTGKRHSRTDQYIQPATYRDRGRTGRSRTLLHPADSTGCPPTCHARLPPEYLLCSRHTGQPGRMHRSSVSHPPDLPDTNRNIQTGNPSKHSRTINHP